MAVVTAPLVIAKRADGSDVYLYEGAAVPEGLLKGEVKRLTDAGLVDGDEPETDEAQGYSVKSKADLVAEVNSRNEGRDDDDKIVVEGNGNKPDLIAALEADDSK